MTDPPSQGRPQPGTILGDKYRLVREIGAGGVGIVYEAEHLTFKKRVAIKVLRTQFASDPSVRARFTAEGQAAAAIGHANVVEVYDLGECPSGAPYLVMQLCPGDTLAQIIEKSAPLEVSDACELILQALAGLSAAHKQGIVHRDLKAGNIIVTFPRPDRPLVKLLDFGTTVGNPVDAHPDLSALGGILYELLAGKPPAQLAQMIEGVLAVKFDQRSTSAADFAQQLVPFVSRARAAAIISLHSPSFPLNLAAPNAPKIAVNAACARPLMTDSLLKFPKIPRAPATPRIHVSEMSCSSPPSALVPDIPLLSDSTLLRSAKLAASKASRTVDSSRQLTSALVAAGTGFSAGLLLAHLAGLI